MKVFAQLPQLGSLFAALDEAFGAMARTNDRRSLTKQPLVKPASSKRSSREKRRERGVGSRSRVREQVPGWARGCLHRRDATLRRRTWTLYTEPATRGSLTQI